MSSSESEEEPIPRLTIDLARPPRERYDEVVYIFGARMRALTGLFDDLLSIFIPYAWLRSIVLSLARVFLRRVYDDEENEEIKGISAASGVPLYLLVALNSTLDCLLGCTSGAVPVSFSTLRRKKSESTIPDATRLLHFRTLDWGMDELRDLIVVLEFVDSSSDHPSKVIARSITYAGFVGSLTAVRPGFSISLNHRASHDCPGRNLRWHQSMVLLGRRRSVGSVMRSLLLHPYQQVDDARDIADNSSSHFAKLATHISRIPTAPCYLILCDGQEATVIIKDYVTGTVTSTRGFIAQTNHDLKDHERGLARMDDEPSTFHQDRREVLTSPLAVDGWIEESAERLECIQRKWFRHAQKFRAKQSGASPEAEPSIKEATLRKWMAAYPTYNECTHFAAILDPKTGHIRWLVKWVVDADEPL